MRITGGKARGVPLKAPKGDATRPATDRMREAVFSSLGAGVEGCRVADLFAGSGSYGLEALSRGAVACNFYENDRRALACLESNLAAVAKSAGLPKSVARVEKRDLLADNLPEAAFDLVFADPPYQVVGEHLELLFTKVLDRIAATDAIVLFELPGDLEPAIPDWQIVRRIGKAGRDKPTVARFERLPR